VETRKSELALCGPAIPSTCRWWPRSRADRARHDRRRRPPAPRCSRSRKARRAGPRRCAPIQAARQARHPLRQEYEEESSAPSASADDAVPSGRHPRRRPRGKPGSLRPAGSGNARRSTHRCVAGSMSPVRARPRALRRRCVVGMGMLGSPAVKPPGNGRGVRGPSSRRSGQSDRERELWRSAGGNVAWGSAGGPYLSETGSGAPCARNTAGRRKPGITSRTTWRVVRYRGARTGLGRPSADDKLGCACVRLSGTARPGS